MKKLLSLLATSAASVVFLGGASHGLTPSICINSQLEDQQDISGIEMPVQHTPVDTKATYGDLNNNTDLLNIIKTAISDAIGTTITNDDIVVTNDQVATDKQISGTVIKFHVQAADDSQLIKGGFDFNNVLIIVNKTDISNVIITDPKTTANINETYGDLNNNTDLVNLIVKTISDATSTAITKDDIIISNDQDQTAKQVVGTAVKFHVQAADSSQLIKGEFDFINTLKSVSRADISNVTITDPQTIANTSITYGALNSNPNLLNIIETAISKTVGTPVASNDFVVTNDQDQTAKQVVGTAVKFHVQAADSSQTIAGGFDFTNTLTKVNKVDISNINITDPQTYTSPIGNYNQLNSNQAMIDKIIQAINQQYQIQVTPNDFTITNDQDPQAAQSSGQVVNFTVKANDTSNLITGTLNFNNTLRVPDLSDITIDNLSQIADPTQNYNALNSNPSVLTAIRTALANKFGTRIPISYMTITNDQKGEDMQAAGKVVTFTVTAKGTDQQIIGNFTFTATLNKTDISNIKIQDLGTPITSGATYGDLNTDDNVISSIRRNILAQTGINVAPSDLTITNDQTATDNQAQGTQVTFTVTATDASGLITGTFKFTDTLSTAKVNITALTIYDYTSYVNPDQTYGDLNDDPTINNMIVQLINHTYNVNCTSDDFTLTNNQNQNAKQTKQTMVTFLVTANPDSDIIAGRTTFVAAISARDITNITIPDLKITTNTDQTYGDLNTNSDIINQIVDQINSQLNYKINPSDLVITNDQDQSAQQVKGTKVTYTVTALNGSQTITGNFRIVATLQ